MGGGVRDEGFAFEWEENGDGNSLLRWMPASHLLGCQSARFSMSRSGAGEVVGAARMVVARKAVMRVGLENMVMGGLECGWLGVVCDAVWMC